MTLIHAGYMRLVPEGILNQIEALQVKKVGAKRGNSTGKKRVRLTPDMKKSVEAVGVIMILEGSTHLTVYERLVELGLIANEEGTVVGYVTISRYLTDMKRRLSIDVRPLYLKVRDKMKGGMKNPAIAKALGISEQMVRRAKSKLRCVQKRQRLNRENYE